MTTIVGIVLAAGRSSRMGRPKALLPIPPEGTTFVDHAVRILRDGGVPHVLVVGRPEDAALRDHVGRLQDGVSYVVNHQADEGQLSSLLAGLAHAEAAGAGAIAVLPVDLPAVRAQTVSMLVLALEQSAAWIVRPTHAGRRGHPVIFRAPLFEALRAADPRVGAKDVVHRHADRVLDVEVTDPGVLRDVDVPADYDALFGT